MQARIVPWFDSNEWFKVYDNLYGPNSNLETKQEALNLLITWKARCPSLPSSIESTLGLLQVHIQDIQLEKNENNLHYLLQLAYSSAIIRLVNHVLDSKAAKGATLYQAAKEVGLPDWIIDLRHDAAHSDSLASLELLRDATSLCLKWLHTYYWKKHKDSICDYKTGNKSVYKDDKILTLANLCIAISICAHPQCNIKGLSDVPEENMQEIMIDGAKDLFGDCIDVTNAKTLSIKSLIHFLNSQSKKWLQNDHAKTSLIMTLLDEDLFLSLKLVQDLGGKEFYKNNCLSRHYMRSLEVLLNFLHKNDLILKFISELIVVTQCENAKHHIRKLAGLWIREIAKALYKSKLFIEKYKRLKTNDENFKKTNIKTQFQQWFPNEDKKGIILHLLKPVPQELTDRYFVYNLVSVSNPYLSYYVRDILNLICPPESKFNVDMICNLAGIMSGNKCSVDNVQSKDKIYTVKDLEINFENFDKLQNAHKTQNDDCMMKECDIEENGLRGGIWNVASKSVNWSLCPIGVLPWQQNNMDKDVEHMEE
ncbi:Protein LAS1 [Eumeta japonica]|uniref:Protein LAS1 n=1 Tax=Eumeta variegata TaxID=151549 RepID=A0A4C1V0N5_EUMVA|nr:Protein LAS1 [Eumeta japonica]